MQPLIQVVAHSLSGHLHFETQRKFAYPSFKKGKRENWATLGQADNALAHSSPCASTI